MSDQGRAALRKAALVAGITLVASAGAFGWYRSRPAFDSEEVSEAQAGLDAERLELLQLTCSRTAFGEASPTDQDAFDAFVFGSRWEECRTLASEERMFQAVTNAAGHSYDWELDRGDGEDLSPPVEHAQYMALYAPPRRAERVDAAEAACEGLDEQVARLAATDDLCTPSRPSPSGWDRDVQLVPMIQTAKGVGVSARRAAREQGAYAGLQLLLQAIAVARDFRRGPANLIVAMVSVAAEGILVSHVVTFLMADPALSHAEYASLDATLETILADAIELHPLWRAERNTFGDLASADDEASHLMVMSASSLDLSWCPEGADAESCLEELRGRPPTEDGPPSELRLLLLGPRSSRASMLRWTHDELLQSYGRYIQRILQADSNLSLLRAALAWSEARAAHASCPPTLPEARRRIPTSDALVEVVHFDGDVYEMQAPPVRFSEGAERTVFNLSCPAARTAWFDADGNAIPEPLGLDESAASPDSASEPAPTEEVISTE